MTKPSPLISVIVTTYNCEKYIADTLKSVLNQTYKNFEIIIVDDSSSDNTISVIKEIMQLDSRIFLHKTEHAGRPSVPRNLGIQKAQGQYLAFLDGDDIWIPHKLESQLNYFERNTEYSFCYSMSVTFGDVNIFSPKFEVLPLFSKQARTKSELISKGNPVTCSTVLVKTHLIKEVGGFDEDIELKVEDYDLWIRLAEYGPICFVPRIQTFYRVHNSQFSSDWGIKQARLKYLALKRNLKIPEYKFFRNRGFLFLLLRNLIHIGTYIIFSFLNLIDRGFIYKR
ncbi:MAG: glycosyltransferase family A protein [bacterium]